MTLSDGSSALLPENSEALATYCRRLEAELRLERSHLGSLFAAMPDMVCIASTDGYFRRLSSSWEQVLGYSLDELLSIPYRELIHPDDREPTRLEVERQLAGCSTAHFVNRYRTKDGRYLWLEWNASPADDGNLFAVARDITARREEEMQLRLWADAFRYCAHGLAVGDPSTNTIVACNPAFAALHGMTPEELTGRALLELYPADVHDYVHKQIAILHDKSTTSFETDRLRRDGSRFPVQMDVVCVKDASMRPLYMIASVQDVSKRKEFEKALLRSEAQFRSVVEAAPEGIFIQTDGRFAYLNPAAMAIFGCRDQDELLDGEVIGRFHPDFRELVAERIRQLNELRLGVEVVEETVVRMDGSLATVEVSAVPFLHNGKAGALVFMRNVTERKRAMEERQVLEKQLQEAQKLESIGRLAGGIAHDLNNLLTPVLGYAEMLESELSGLEEQREEARMIREASLSARKLIWQLLAFSRTQTLELEPVDLNEVVGKACRLQQSCVGSQVAVELSPDVELPRILGNASQLEQVVMNLVMNARDAMPSGGRLRIATSVVVLQEPSDGLPAGRYAALEVTDTGEGIAAEDLPRIFEPFFTTKGAGKGTGLGLPSVYGIVKQHRGNIQATSTPGRGTTFRVLIPALEESAAAPGAADSCSPGEARYRVLVVEDNDMVRKFTMHALEMQGYEVTGAESGDRALGMVVDGAVVPDLVISDIMMPGMNGVEFVGEVRKLLPEVRVLFMSGHTSDHVKQQVMALSGNDILSKPFTAKVLMERVRRETGVRREEA